MSPKCAKLKCHFLLAQNAKLTAPFSCLCRVLAEVELAPGMRSRHDFTFLLRLGCRARGCRLKQLRLNYLSLLLFVFAVDGVLERSLLISDRDLSRVLLTHFD